MRNMRPYQIEGWQRVMDQMDKSRANDVKWAVERAGVPLPAHVRAYIDERVRWENLTFTEFVLDMWSWAKQHKLDITLTVLIAAYKLYTKLTETEPPTLLAPPPVYGHTPLMAPACGGSVVDQVFEDAERRGHAGVRCTR